MYELFYSIKFHRVETDSINFGLKINRILIE